PTNQPPRSLNDIKTVTIVFPNLSAKGSGGELKAGHKVKIGRFEPGTSVGMVLLANGWNGNQVKDYYHAVFADKNLNPEPDTKLRQHNVLLWDEENKLFLLGFEDVRRDNIPIQCDQDFNDAILFVSSNPVKAISTVNVSPVDKPGTTDRDGDGINDNLDEYPDDKDKAYDSYYPSATGFGSFAFEDNWPEMGDYDFNDLVVDYQIKQTHNSDNKVVELQPNFKFRAIGAGFRNGFGFSTDLAPSDVKSITGQRLGPNLIKNSSNGTEANQSKAVIIVTDNVHELFGAHAFVNTDPSNATHQPVEVKLTIKLTTPKTRSEIGSAPYNPFLIVSQDRGREVHLPSYPPTNLAATEYFGEANDNTDVSKNRYYTSKTSLPWAIHTPESFDYPQEKMDVRSGHLRFDDWAKSSGYSYMDWYRPQIGYRNDQKLYKK
ncbi:MAG: LruC domain-containing protein, partial [Algoriphagus sp.]